MSKTSNVEVYTDDIPEGLEEQLFREQSVAWDLETTGLNWATDDIATCQVHGDGAGTALVRMESKTTPLRLSRILSNPAIRKIFHHAAFDLRFMRWQWGARPTNVACTKVASKIVWPGAAADDYSLKPLLERTLNISINKSERLSNWQAERLSESQIDYAASDVRYLSPLLEAIASEARHLGVARLIDASFEYLPTRVETDLRGCGDVFSY